MTISAQILVENEENFIWYSVMSVLPYVEEVLVYNAGSVDKTGEILKTIQNLYPGKVILKNIKKLSLHEYPVVRDRMLKETSCDWILVIDGDEVWWDDSLFKLTELIRQRGKSLDSVVTPFVNCIGDIYHYQSEKAGKYAIDHKKGNVTIHAINTKVRDLCVRGDYGKEGYYSHSTAIQHLPLKRRHHFEFPCFLHLSHLKRTSVHSLKVKRETGIMLPADFYYPEVFFRSRPKIVKDPWSVPLLKERSVNDMLGFARKVKRWIT